MTIAELIKLVDSVYDPCDRIILRYWNTKTECPQYLDAGDDLAFFIVNELFETYDPEATEDEQLQEAIRIMDTAVVELQRVRDAFEKLRVNKGREK